MCKMLLTALLLALSGQAAHSQIPALISIQGTLTDAAGDIAANGIYRLEITIWNDSTATAPDHLLWSETHPAVAVNGGFFQLLMGSITPLDIPFDQSYWFQIGATSSRSSWVILPRIRLTAAAYSLSARAVADNAIRSRHIADRSLQDEDLADGTLTARTIQAGQVLKSLNGLRDVVQLQAGDNVRISTRNNAITIDAVFPDAPPAIASLNGLTDEVFLQAGENMVISTQDNAITIAQKAPQAVSSLRPSGNPSTIALSVNAAGQIGIGTTAFNNILTVRQHAATTPLADAWAIYSSRRWKENIRTLDNGLATVQALRGVRYTWKETGKPDIGLIAEEVGQVVPEVVAYEANGTDAASVDYARLVAVLIEAVKEQQQYIAGQRNELTTLQRKTADLEEKYQQLDARLNALLLGGDHQ